MIERAREMVKEIPASTAWGLGLITIGFVLVSASMLFHYSLFAMILTGVMFFSTGIGGWLLGRESKR